MNEKRPKRKLSSKRCGLFEKTNNATLDLKKVLLPKCFITYCTEKKKKLRIVPTGSIAWKQLMATSQRRRRGGLAHCDG